MVFVSSAGGSGAELDIFPFLRFFRQGVCKRLEGFDSLRNELFNRLKELAKQNACADPEGTSKLMDFRNLNIMLMYVTGSEEATLLLLKGRECGIKTSRVSK